MKLSNYIQVFENIIPLDLCDRIIEEYESTKIWRSASIKDGSVDKKIRSVNTIPISCDDVISQNTNSRKEIDTYLFRSAAVAVGRYTEMFPASRIEEDSGYELLRYGEGDFYIQHTDSFKGASRSVSCSFLLNDEYEGGDFGFFDKELKIKVPKGCALMFPSNFMYPHEVLPVTKGTRYSIITWFV
jgi:predicted 2-oxoglutarate/Fe(II)-dependent dioxygenase YbiX